MDKVECLLFAASAAKEFLARQDCGRAYACMIKLDVLSSMFGRYIFIIFHIKANVRYINIVIKRYDNAI